MRAVLYEVKDEIAWLTINRPEIRNAVNFEVMEMLEESIGRAESDSTVKVLAVTGSGTRAFCSGGDLAAFQSLRTSEEAFMMLSRMGSVLKSLFYFPKLTAAVINGTAVGGGCELAASCDIRLAAAGVRLGFIQGKLGITTGWGGGSFLIERAGLQAAQEMLYSSALFTAKQAHDNGFIQYVFKEEDVKNAAARFLQRYTAQPEGVIRSYKQLFLDRIDRAAFDRRLQNEIKRCSILWESDDHHDRVNQFLSKS